MKHAAALLLGITLVTGIAVAGTGQEDLTKKNIASTPHQAREAGARYGQAMGVALMCYGLEVTPAARDLQKSFSGRDLEEFNAEAEKILAAWREASSCKTAGGPNPCRLLHEWSCRDALKEIGPGGTAIPDLVASKPNEMR